MFLKRFSAEGKGSFIKKFIFRPVETLLETIVWLEVEGALRVLESFDGKACNLGGLRPNEPSESTKGVPLSSIALDGVIAPRHDAERAMNVARICVFDMALRVFAFISQSAMWVDQQ